MVVSYNEVDGLVKAYWLLILVGCAPSDKRKIIRSCMVFSVGGYDRRNDPLTRVLGAMSLWGW